MFYDSVRSLVAASSIREQLKRREGVLNKKRCWVESFYSKTEREPETEFMKPETSALGDIIPESHGLINAVLIYDEQTVIWQEKLHLLSFQLCYSHHLYCALIRSLTLTLKFKLLNMNFVFN